MLFDSHAHYDDSRFDEDRDFVVSLMQENNVGKILNSCSNLSDIPKILDICEKYPFMYASAGIHPHDVEFLTDEDMDTLKKFCENPHIIAVGEIGLDYYYDSAPRDLQTKWFAKQINVAREVNLPIIIHDRDAHGDCMDILHAERIKDVGGVFHCYAGSVEMAKEILDFGMYIAFGGTLTFKNSVRAKDCAAFVPLDRILIETDCPYLAPEPFRGKRNSSLYISKVCEKIAEIKGISYEQVENATYENAVRCFNL